MGSGIQRQAGGPCPEGLTGWQRPPSNPKLHITMETAHPDMESYARHCMGVRAGMGTQPLGTPQPNPRDSQSPYTCSPAWHDGTQQDSDHLSHIDALRQDF